ncbi:hypothetical protein CXF85_11045 [Colwellia sp. 75C3]|uniref:hypothetical protein n=1 Tax=Colwellia sp. 75C3 TaxID=888425 RepID=UPI000CBEADD7|nr:hypothetical protein [Colwellia sp. 75C3]PKG83532.1 hypothetical protein CXF85_11045 [Colwellia sp. 75C3]
MKYLNQLKTVLVLLIYSATATAGYVCDEWDDLSTVTLTSMALVTAPTEVIDLTSFSGAATGYGDDGREATECAGFFDGNDMKTPDDHNIGEWGDGFFNGELQNAKISPSNTDILLNPDNMLFDPLYLDGIPNVSDNIDDLGDGFNDDLVFIGPDDIQDIGGDGIFDKDGEVIESTGQDDPGWVFLGRTNDAGNDFDYADTGIGLFDENDNSLQLNIGELITIDFGCDVNNDTTTDVNIINNDGCNQWSLSPIASIAEDLDPLFGDGFFDHLAFVIKAGDEFIIYDFNFNIIKAEIEGITGLDVDLEVPYNLAGTFNWLGTHAISHISVYAHDPILEDGPTVISEPRASLLLLFGVILILLRLKSTRVAL